MVLKGHLSHLRFFFTTFMVVNPSKLPILLSNSRNSDKINHCIAKIIDGFDTCWLVFVEG